MNNLWYKISLTNTKSRYSDFIWTFCCEETWLTKRNNGPAEFTVKNNKIISSSCFFKNKVFMFR